MVIKIDLKSLDCLCGRTVSSKCTMFQSRNTDFDSYAVSGRSYGASFGNRSFWQPICTINNKIIALSAQNVLFAYSLLDFPALKSYYYGYEYFSKERLRRLPRP